MFLGTSTARNSLRSLLILGRVSNLPTVWSNCLCGWWLAGGGTTGTFLLLALGATSLYLGGMFLNDAFDAPFDRQFRPDRPIPAGRIQARTVWILGWVWLGAGLVLCGLLGRQTAVLTILLAAGILLYNGLHKVFALSPIIMAACRFLLILSAASAAQFGINGFVIWTALVLGCYVVGLSFLARRETIAGPLRYWPLIFLAAPIVLALIVNQGPYLGRGLLLCLLLTAWIVRCLWITYWADQPNVGRSVAGLLAGIVLVDWLALGGGSPLVVLLLSVLFLLALAAQRFIPAT